jgi:hypothetical protein
MPKRAGSSRLYSIWACGSLRGVAVVARACNAYEQCEGACRAGLQGQLRICPCNGMSGGSVDVQTACLLYCDWAWARAGVGSVSSSVREWSGCVTVPAALDLGRYKHTRSYHLRNRCLR